jgi:DMSO/TMAO reductase YedYZ molybdopterin-dependent catalytic subunit
MSKLIVSRRRLIRAGATFAATLPLAGCDAFDFLQDGDSATRAAMIGINRLTYRAQRLLLGADALAPEFSEADIRQAQRPNGSTAPDTDDYVALQANAFAGYKLTVSGLVESPQSFTLSDLKAMPSRTQITRHDCVEGWSTIAKWQGVPLKAILDSTGVKPQAKFVLFRCYDALTKSLSGPDLYYETIDLVDAQHPQTILAYAMNGNPLPIANGAPLRVRVERQLGYKMAKYIRGIELIDDFSGLNGGKGGYWEDRGYEWYAGI